MKLIANGVGFSCGQDTCTLSNSTVSNNTIGLLAGEASDFVVKGTTIANNGTGARVEPQFGYLEAQNSTFTGNTLGLDVSIFASAKVSSSSFTKNGTAIRIRSNADTPADCNSVTLSKVKFSSNGTNIDPPTC